MRLGVRWAVAIVGSCLLGFMGLPAFALGDDSGSVGGSSGSFFGGQLVVSGSPLENEQLLDQQRARLASPEARFARELSRTSHQGLGRAASAGLAREVFPDIVDRAGGLFSQSPISGSVLRYVSGNVAQ